MMIEIVFNELSASIKTSSLAHTKNVFSQFMTLADKITALKIAPVRIRSSINLSNISIGTDYYTLKDWLKTLDNDSRQRYVAYLVQDPIIVDNPYFYYGDTEVSGFGYAFNNSLGLICFSVDNEWDKNTYEIRSEFLADNGEDIIFDTVEVKNLLCKEDKINHEKWIDEQFRLKKQIMSKEFVDFEDFWEKRNALFPSLLFCNDVLNQIMLYGSVNDTSFKKAVRYLHSLENHISDVNKSIKKFDELPGDISNDSEATINKYKEERTFVSPDNSSQLFSMHSKLGNLRIYFSHYNESILIGYIGKHLKTVKFN